MVVLLGFVALGGVLFFNSVASDSSVKYKDVQRVMLQKERAKNPEPDATRTSNVKVPKKFDKYFDGSDNRRVLIGWLEALEPSQRAEFLDELWAVIKWAEDEKPTAIVDAINEYQSLKFVAFAKEESNRMMVRMMRILTALGIVMILGLAAVFSLVIAILSLERANRGALDRNTASQPLAPASAPSYSS
ncbi:MAG: hypothetical protein ACYC7A_21720 [Thermoanaerobaculia bacterium]